MSPAVSFSDLAERELRDELDHHEHAILQDNPTDWYDALVVILQDIDRQLSIRNAATAGRRLPKDEWAEYRRWRGGALHFKRHVTERMAEVRRLRRQHNLTARGPGLRHAIEQHRQTVLDEGYEPTDADQQLWAHLNDREHVPAGSAEET